MNERVLRERKRRKRIFFFILAVGGIGLIICTAYLIIANKYPIKKITVKGLNAYSEPVFLDKISTPKARSNRLLFRLEQKMNGKKTIPYIEKYDITYENDTVTIQVYEKILIGCVEVMGQYLYFDRDGLVSESSPNRREDIPLIRGLEFDRIMLYQKLDIEHESRYRTILNITKLLNEVKIPTQTILFDSIGNVNLEIGSVTVQLGKREVYDIAIYKLADIYPKIEDRSVVVYLADYDGGKGNIIVNQKN